MGAAPDFGMHGKVAIVTGGAGGIGQTYGAALGAAGAKVALADLDLPGAEAAAQELRGHGIEAIAVEVDITDEDSTKRMAAAVTDAIGGIDALVNNAALMAAEALEPIMEVAVAGWDKTMAINVTGALNCSRACAPSMIERGGGKIVNQSSGGAWHSATPYAISKLAIVGLTSALARALGRHNINVNAIAPGAVETAAALKLFPQDSEWRTNMRAISPLRGSAPPEDLCGALVFLCSPASDWMTGQCLNVDGGWVIRY